MLKGGRRGIPIKPSIKKRPPIAGAVPRSRPEGIRWLRSDGTPNWSQRVREMRGSVAEYATRPAEIIRGSSTILEAAERITRRRIRGLIVVGPGGGLEGILTAMNLVDYLGGGEYYRIVSARHGGSIFRALVREAVSSIASGIGLYATVRDHIEDLVKDMVVTGIGIVPVVNEEGNVYGVVTERDIIGAIAGRRTGRSIGEVMTTTVITVNSGAPIVEAARLMTKYGFRRIPVVSEESGELVGMITAKDYVAFFGSHEAFKKATTGSLEEALETPVEEVMTGQVYIVGSGLDVGSAALIMKEKGLDSLIVASGGRIEGIVTERDLLVAMALEEV